ncbi:MAG TPA: class I SAM-dependent RNA methyltransferase [Candidatus Omnitrophota bacterium]|nr:class I SAM-dependent RNA methyltransferase [Candidatus Omnitrophota bacterium]
MDLNLKSRILVTCSRGVTPFLEKEIKLLGFDIVSTHETGLVTEARLIDTYKLNLELRTAFNVLFLLEEFKCSSPEDLYRKASLIEWEKIIPQNEYISVVSQVSNPRIKNSMFANQKLKDAIVDRMTKKTGNRPNSGPERRNIVINLYWKNDTAWIYINTSGVKLADRGYRKIPLTAPMQETLAAAVLSSAGYDGSGHLVNPMCGSGTIAIEAALIALNKAPGLLRSNYGFLHLKNCDKEYWQKMRKERLALCNKKPAKKIIATDIDKTAIEAAVKNATTCGVDHLIEFKVSDFRETTIPEGPGKIILNPEYGERMGDIDRLVHTYKEIGDFFKKKCVGYEGYIFTGNLELSKKVGLAAKKRVPFFSGDIDCRLLEYDIY